MTSVSIRGDGVAARCCAHLLRHAGIRVYHSTASRPRLPAILLSEPAQLLLRDIFEREDLFRGLPRIQKRLVAWGKEARPVALDHSAVVISEEALLERMGAAAAREDGPAGWTIHAGAPLPDSVSAQAFGSRTACAIPVKLSRDAEPAACWIESLPEGWLFLITTQPGAGWLLAVGQQPDALPAESRWIHSRIADRGAAGAEFPASPRVAAPLAGPGWIACGTAAMAFDPICGDGTAQAVREAILASAVIQAAARGGDLPALAAHYETRLLCGFQRHLAHCLEYYRSGGHGPWWLKEAGRAAEGIAWCASRVGGEPRFRYRLNGLDLEIVEF
jgi:hypothetical protein